MDCTLFNIFLFIKNNLLPILFWGFDCNVLQVLVECISDSYFVKAELEYTVGFERGENQK